MSGSSSLTAFIIPSEDFSIISSQEGDMNNGTILAVREKTPGTNAQVSDDGSPTERSMSTSWMIREILDTIFSFLVPQYDVLTQTVLQGKPYNMSGDRATLLSAALICRAAFDAAQAALWNTMDSFAPIVPFLPLIKVGDRYNLRDSPVRSFQHPLEYLRRIRVFIFDKTEDFMSDFAVQMAFSSIAPVLFPNLHKLIIPNFENGPTPDQKLFLPRLLASPLQEIVVGDIHSSEAFEAFTSVLAFTARNSLRSISCSWNHLPRAITTVTSLHTVVLTAPMSNQSALLTDLSICPSLRRLELCISQDIPKESDLPTRTSKPVFFDHLESLTLSGKYGGMQTFLQLLTSRNLHRLQLQPELEIWPDNFEPHLVDLMSLLSHREYKSLKSFELAYSNTPPSCSNLDDNVSLALFQGLLALPLVSLRLSGPIRLGAITLDSIGASFLNLHTLYLPKYGQAARPTFHDLHLLAQSAPNLRHLGTRIRTKPIQMNPRASTHCLDTLCVYDSRIEDPWYVAEQLDQSFPYLRKVIYTREHGHEYEQKWKEVERLLGLCQRSRRRF